MPDLATHAIGGYLLYRVPQAFKKEPTNCRLGLAAFVFGNILPDILTRPAFILFPQTFEYVSLIHSPFIMLLISALLATFLKESVRLRAGAWMFSGTLLHMTLDHFQIHIYYHNYWFFPFYNQSSGIGWYGVDSSLTLLPYLFILFTIAVVWVKKPKPCTLGKR